MSEMDLENILLGQRVNVGIGIAAKVAAGHVDVVDVAEDGAEALDKISNWDFGVVLLDVRLPKIGGLDILARCSHKPHPPKVIVMTGVDTTDVVLDALRRQAYDFLPKPIEPVRLIEVIKRAGILAPE